MSLHDLEHPEPAAWWLWLTDLLTWVLPILAALTAGAGGWAALDHADQWSAGWGIGSAFLSAVAVIFTNIASRIRDRQIARARAISDTHAATIDRLESRNTSNF